MQGFSFEVNRGGLVVRDLVNRGSLHISFKPGGKPAIPPHYEAWCDLETDISSGKLNLNLFGLNTIREWDGFYLSGSVLLRSSHLFDPTIENSTVQMCSLKPRVRIINSNVAYLGCNRFGSISIEASHIRTTPKGGFPKGHSRYYQNRLMR